MNRSACLVVLLLLPALGPGCRDTPPPKAKAPPVVGRVPTPPPPPDLDADLPIRASTGGRFAADDPTWTRADSFRRTPREYDQPSWDHVRGIVATHLAISGRDLARLHGAREEWKACAEAYTGAAADVRAVNVTEPDVLAVRDQLAADLDRDAALCAALAAGTAPPEVGTGLAAARARVLGIGLRAVAGADVRREAAAAADALRTQAVAGFSPPPPSASASPAEKQLWLVRAWGDTVDPLVVTDPWGPWTLEEPRRQAAALAATLDAIASGDHKSLHLRPAASLRPQPQTWTAAEFTRIAQRDAWADVGGFATPHVNAQLDLDTAAWTETNGALAARWSKLREGEVPRAVRRAVAAQDDHPEGLRWFEALALQNGAIRQLARAGHYLEALDVLRDQSPPRGLDWFSPNRAGVLLGLEGRLRLLSGDREAHRKLREARAEALAFLTFVHMCEDLEAAPAR